MDLYLNRHNSLSPITLRKFAHLKAYFENKQLAHITKIVLLISPIVQAIIDSTKINNSYHFT